MRKGRAAFSASLLFLATLLPRGRSNPFSASNRSDLLSPLAALSEAGHQGSRLSRSDQNGTQSEAQSAAISSQTGATASEAVAAAEESVSEGRERWEGSAGLHEETESPQAPTIISVDAGGAVIAPLGQVASPEGALRGEQAPALQKLSAPATEVVREAPETLQADSQEEEEDDRHNFALAKDGAKIVAVNKEAKKASALLDNDADTFLKNECKADKWVVMELSQIAKVDTLLISQNELYSSRMKEFEVKGRQTHPRTEGTDYGKQLNSSAWQLLGRFNASNAKGTQAFKLERPTWTKYLQLHILSHYGSEAVCALNDVCVFGKSAAEDLEARLNFEQPDLEDSDSGHEVISPEGGHESSAEAVKALLVKNDSHDAPITAGVLLSPSKESAAVQDETPAGGSDAFKVLRDQCSHDDGLNAGSLSTPPSSEAAPTTENASAASPRSVSSSPAAGTEPSSQKHVPLDKEIVAEKPSEKSLEGATTEESLPANSAGSAATRHGGSVYDMIVQELKAIKLAQKAGAQTLTQLQRNVTAVMGGFAFELDLLAAELRRTSPSRPALMPAGAEDLQCAATGNGSRALPGDGLDFREGQCSRRQPPLEGVQVVKPATELELLQLEVAALREMVLQSKRQADGMLLALAASLLGGIGFNLVLNSGRPVESLTRGGMLLVASIPLGLASCFWLRG